MIDVHTHLNLNVQDSTHEYLEFFKKSTAEAAVLILNSQEESGLFWENSDAILKGNNIHIAFLLDINNTDYFAQNAALAKERGITYSIKLHPRLTDITENEFEAIGRYVEGVAYKNIIVDSFLYGSKKENICYIELSTYLAKRFPDKNIVMAHFGGIKVLETMLRTRELPNIYYDCSFSVNYLYGTSAWMDLRHCILYSPNRVVYGSDRPSFTVDESVKKVKELLGEQSEEFYDNLFSRNARRLFFDET